MMITTIMRMIIHGKRTNIPINHFLNDFEEFRNSKCTDLSIQLEKKIEFFVYICWIKLLSNYEDSQFDHLQMNVYKPSC